MISVKIHRSYRDVVAVCDSELIGKKYEEGTRQLDLRENFYRGEEMDENSIVNLLMTQKKEDATFNIVGKESVQAAVKAGIIEENESDSIAGIPFVLILI